MATVQEPRSAHRAEQFVQKELTRAVRRVRLLDITRAALGLLIAVMVYGLVMILADRWLNFSQTFRQVSLLGFFGFVALYVWFVLLGPIRRAVNPYYAALQVEQTIPDAKNSLVNWLDLHDDNLPKGIVTAIDERAAEDLKESNVDEAIKSNSLLWLAGITLGLFVGFAATFILFRGDQFSSLLGRAFSPFGTNRGIVKQTRISIVTPPEGDLMVAINRPVTITVKVDGRIPETDRPDSIRLKIRYNGDDANYDKELPLKQVDGTPSEWTIRLGLNEVRTGFWYRVAGGDDQTAEHRVQVRSTPNIERFEVVSHYRPYLRWGDRNSRNPNIEDYRGTEITLDAVTNRQVSEGRLNFADKSGAIVGEKVPDRPEVIRFKFTLERDNKYRIWFQTAENESSNDPNPYTIHVLQDAKPTIELTKPATDVTMPADDMLRLEGIARDDFGIRKVVLRMTLDGQALKPREYMTEQDYRLDTGGFMKTIDYKDAVDPMKLETALGTATKPGTGSILEYWLETTDNCDYPDGTQGQVATTRKYTVKFQPPRVDDKPEFDRDPMKAEEEKKKHEAAKQGREQQREETARDKKEHDKKHEQDRKDQSEQQRKADEERKREDEEKNRAPQKPEQANEKNGGQPEKGKTEDKPGNQNDKGEPNPDDPFEKMKKEIAEQKNNGNNDQSANDAGASKEDPSAAKPENPTKPDAAKDKDGSEGKNDPAQMKENNGGQPDMDKAASSKPPEKPQDGGGAPGDSKSPPPPNQTPNESTKPGDSGSGQNNTPNTPNKPQDGGNGADNGKNNTPNKPADKSKDGDGSQRDPKANPNDPGKAKGTPDKAPPNKDKAGNPNDASAPPKDNKTPGDGANGKSNKNDSDGATDAKKQQKPSDGSAGNKPQGPSSADPGKSKPKEGNPDPRSKPMPTDAKDGKRDGKDEKGGKDVPADDKDYATDMKKMPKDEPGKGTKKPNDKPGQGGGDQGKQPDKKDGSGGKDDVSKLEDQMKKGNAQEREAAKQKLGEMAKDSSDPKKQKAAQEALQRNQNGQEQPGKPQNPMGGSPKDNDSPKDPMGSKPQPNQAGKPGDQNPSKNGDPKQGENQAKKDGQKQSPASNKPPSNSSDSNQSCSNKACQNPGNSGAPKPSGAPGSADVAQAGESKQGPKDAKGSGSSGTGGAGQTSNPPVANDNKQGGQPKQGDTDKPMVAKDNMKKDGDAKQGTDPSQKGDGQRGKDDSGNSGKDVAKGDGNKQGGKGEKSETPGHSGTPGLGGDNKSRTGDQTGNSPGDNHGQAGGPNQGFKDRSGDLDLEKLDKKKLKELFDKYKITEEQWKEYLRQQAAKKQNEQPTKSGVKDVAPGDRTGGVNVNTGTRRVETNDKDNGMIRAGSSGSAPPEYKKAADRFAEKMAKEPAKK